MDKPEIVDYLFQNSCHEISIKLPDNTVVCVVLKVEERTVLCNASIEKLDKPDGIWYAPNI